MSIPFVKIIVADNGASAALVVPLPSIQVKIGVATAGPYNVPVATTNPNTLVANFDRGPTVEAGGLVCKLGGVVVFVRIPVVTIGTATAVVPTVTFGSSTTVTVTLDGTYGAFDTFYPVLLCTSDGTIGTAGIQFQLSLDAGRTYGAVFKLGTANTYAIPDTGITLHFAAGTMKAGDSWRFSTVAPQGDAAGILAAIDALEASPYGNVGWGSMHIVGTTTASLVGNIQTDMDALEANYIFSRCIVESRDASPPAAFGGSGESEATWINSLETAFSAVNADRVVVSAGYYNMPSVYPNSAAGLPSYRRPLSFAAAVRRTQVPPQRRGGRVKDGSLVNIVVNPTSDPNDGFIYHNERTDPGLNDARFMTAMTWQHKQGFFVVIEKLMSTTGSQFTELPLGNVVDAACDIGYAVGIEQISDDLLLTSDGLLDSNDALTLQNAIDLALFDGMTSVAMVSSATSAVDASTNVRSTHNIPIAITVNPRGYIDSITETINLQA